MCVRCGAARKATAVITQKPHSSADLHIGSPSVAIESEILCFDYNLWPTSAPLIALYPADHNACNERVTGHLSPSFPHTHTCYALTKTEAIFSWNLYANSSFCGVIFLHDAAILFSILSPCVMKSGRDVSICRAGAALYGSVIATAPFLIQIFRAGMEFVPFDL
jgi:hypothetical protein